MKGHPVNQVNQRIVSVVERQCYPLPSLTTCKLQSAVKYSVAPGPGYRLCQCMSPLSPTLSLSCIQGEKHGFKRKVDE